MTIKKKTNKKTMISLMLASIGVKLVNFRKLVKLSQPFLTLYYFSFSCEFTFLGTCYFIIFRPHLSIKLLLMEILFIFPLTQMACANLSTIGVNISVNFMLILTVFVFLTFLFYTIRFNCFQ